MDGSVAEVACERKQRLASPVTSRLESPSTGYIKLSEFNALAGRDVAAALKSLRERGADRFVLDLRDNPGGLVQAGNEIARLFMGGDVTVVYTENRADRPGPGPPIKAVTTRGDGALRCDLDLRGVPRKEKKSAVYMSSERSLVRVFLE